MFSKIRTLKRLLGKLDHLESLNYLPGMANDLLAARHFLQHLSLPPAAAGERATPLPPVPVGLSVGSLGGADNEARIARAEGRLIITEYPYYPRKRPMEIAAGGQRLQARFRSEGEQYAATLRGMAKHIDLLTQIPRHEVRAQSPFWANDWFPPFDGAVLFGLIAEQAPRRYFEVVSGISTRFARKAIADLGLSTKIISIDPHPHTTIKEICDEIIVSRMEDMPNQFWADIEPGDMLFVDNSHRSFPNSDVTVFFAEVLPALQPGTIYGVHDICLPWDYPEEWNSRFYNEQYLLLAYLLGGAASDEILVPVMWAARQPELHNIFAPLWARDDLLNGISCHGAGFWMRRGGSA